jgi:hypothetical protein
MKNKLEEIYQHTIPHHSFLDKRSIDSCMHQSYILGKEENQEKYNKLKNAFLNLLKELNDTQVEENWKKEGGLI